MDVVSVNIMCSIVASIIFDVSKWGIGKFQNQKSKVDIFEIEQYVNERLDSKFNMLCDSGIFDAFMKSPIVSDTINNYILYKITGKFEQLFEVNNNKRVKEQSILEIDIINYLAENLVIRYSKGEILTIPSKGLINEFLKNYLRSQVNIFLNT